MAGIIPTREAFRRIRDAVIKVEQDRRQDIPGSTRRTRENAQRIHAAEITARSGTLNATYDVEGIANKTVTMTAATPANRLVLNVNYVAAAVGALCFVIEKVDGTRVLWVAEIIETIECDDPEVEAMLAYKHGSNAAADRPDGGVVYWMGSAEPENAEEGDLWNDGGTIRVFDGSDWV